MVGAGAAGTRSLRSRGRVLREGGRVRSKVLWEGEGQERSGQSPTPDRRAPSPLERSDPLMAPSSCRGGRRALFA